MSVWKRPKEQPSNSKCIGIMKERKGTKPSTITWYRRWNMVLTRGGKSAERFHKGGDYVAVTLLARMGKCRKKLEPFWSEKTFYSHVLKANLRETCDSVHCKCTFSPGKEGREGHSLCLCHCIPSFFFIKERNCAFQELRKHKEMKKSKEPARICCTLQAVSTSYTHRSCW